jgi:hypothetical protein
MIQLGDPRSRVSPGYRLWRQRFHGRQGAGQTGLFTVPAHPFGQQRLGRDGDQIIRDPIVDQRELEFNAVRRDRRR